MNTKDFIYHLIEHGHQFIKDDPHSEFRPDVAILSGFLKFPCDFNLKNGKCAGHRDTEECCCSNCKSAVGHFRRRWPNNIEELKGYAEHFDIKTGFWRKGTGCILPRGKRSLTCAFFVCEKIRVDFEQINDKEVLNLRHVVGEYTSCDARNGSRNGQYHRDFVVAENDLDLTVDKFMWDRRLYYDPFVGVLRKVEEQNISEKGWVTRKIKGRDGHVGLNKGKKWVRYMQKEINYV